MDYENYIFLGNLTIYDFSEICVTLVFRIFFICLELKNVLCWNHSNVVKCFFKCPRKSLLKRKFHLKLKNPHQPKVNKPNRQGTLRDVFCLSLVVYCFMNNISIVTLFSSFFSLLPEILTNSQPHCLSNSFCKF